MDEQTGSTTSSGLKHRNTSQRFTQKDRNSQTNINVKSRNTNNNNTNNNRPTHHRQGSRPTSFTNKQNITQSQRDSNQKYRQSIQQFKSQPQTSALMMSLQDKSTDNARNVSNVSGFDEYSASEQYRMSQINNYANTNASEGSVFRPSVNIRGGVDQNEFARCSIARSRCTISSSSTLRDSNSECESNDPRDSLKSLFDINTNDFRGTGQNGQILKHDLPTWSRKLHNKQHQDMFRQEKLPLKSILIGFSLMIIGMSIMVYQIKSTINLYKSEPRSVAKHVPLLKLVAGFLSFLPGSYIVYVFIILSCCKDTLNHSGRRYSYFDISQFQSEAWWDDYYDY